MKLAAIVPFIFLAGLWLLYRLDTRPHEAHYFYEDCPRCRVTYTKEV